MEVGSSTEMGAPGASHLGTGDRGFKTDRSTTISPGKRASVDGSGRLPTGRQTESYSAKSGYNKGTIRSDIPYLVVSKDVRRHRSISISYISHVRCHGRGREFESRRPRHSFLNELSVVTPKTPTIFPPTAVAPVHKKGSGQAHEKCNLRNQYHPGWLLRPHQHGCR
jgi:hypothetical protein